MRIHPRKREGVQVLIVRLDEVAVGPGACQGTVGRHVGRTTLGVGDHQGGMGCLVGSFPPRASAFLFPLTYLCGIASYAR